MKKVDFSKNIMDEIHQKHIKMKTKNMILLENLSMLLLFFVIFASTVLFINFIIYIINNTATMEFLEFGTEGWNVFWGNFPYSIFLVTLMLLVLSYVIYTRYDFSYKRGSNILLIILAAFCVGGGFLLSATKANETVSQFFLFKPVKEMASVKNINDKNGTFVKVIYNNAGTIVAQAPKGKVIIIRYSPTPAPEMFDQTQEMIEKTEFENPAAKEQMMALINQQKLILARLNNMRVQSEMFRHFHKNQILKIIGDINDGRIELNNIKPVKNCPSCATELN